MADTRVRGPLFRRARTTSRGDPGPPDVFGLCARKIAFTRQKIGQTVPKVTAGVAIFRSAACKMNVVLMGL